MYFDATFFVRLYIEEAGFERVRYLVQQSETVTSSILGKRETYAALHGQLREGRIGQVGFQQAHDQFNQDNASTLLNWLPLSSAVIDRVHTTFLRLPSPTFLRTGDAIHLAIASEAGFKEI